VHSHGAVEGWGGDHLPSVETLEEIAAGG
jgi:hypothetical protein